MTNRIVHPGEQFAIDLRAVTANNACYATHKIRLFWKVEPENVTEHTCWRRWLRFTLRT